jgi:septum formation protein
MALLDRGTGELHRARSDSVVSFSPMDVDEIEAYLDTEEWRGVAGAYRIQGAAALHIERIEGSWSGIVGLPIRELYVILRAANYRLRPPLQT